MKTATGRIVFLTFLGVCSVSHVSTFAQSNTDRERDALRSSQDAVRVYVATRENEDEVRPADNLQITSAYQPLIEAMLSRSPTFRRQYARLARAPLMLVVLRADMPAGRRVDALTQISSRGASGVEALVHVMPSTRTVELIAHELEHIIEQLDGVNLRAKSRLRSSGVRVTADEGTFETTRAVLTGQRVAREVLEGSQ
jgi:hypothetical protein